MNPEERKQRAIAIARCIDSSIDLSVVSKAMEYGCGSGLLSFALKDKFDEVTLMDESNPMILEVDTQCEKEGLIHFHPVRFNLLKDKIPNYQYDIIYTMMTLHHIDDTEFILKSFYKLLNKSGYVVIIDLVEEDGSFHNFEFEGHLGFEQKMLETKMERIGFKLIDYQICYTIRKERLGQLRAYPLFMMIGQKV